MSVSFYARGADGGLIHLDLDDPAFLNMASANARLFLEFLRIEPGPDLDGEISLPDARRAVMRARATFDRRAPSFTREQSDVTRAGQARMITADLDVEYLGKRLDALQRFLDEVVERGAVSVLWG